MLIHCNKDETSEDTQDYNIRVGPVPLLDFSQIEKLNITKLIMKDANSHRQNTSTMSDKSPERKWKTARGEVFGYEQKEQEEMLVSRELFEGDTEDYYDVEETTLRR
jgi:hypothetical protein